MSLGISIYFGLDNTFNENMALLNNAIELGYKKIFTSFHVPEANYNEMKRYLEKFFCTAMDYGMEVISDISPNTFKLLGLNSLNLNGLKKFVISTLRIDFGFTCEDIVSMINSEKFKIQINASTVTEKFLSELFNHEINYDNLEALHNFYPRKWTGLSEKFIQHKNEILLRKKIKVGAFVGTKNRKRGPLREGLVTLEKHRNLDCEIAANHLIALKNENIFIGDSLPSKEELVSLSKLKCDAIRLRINLKTQDEKIVNALKNVYFSREDESEYVIRASESREILFNCNINPQNTFYKNVGDITLNNEKYLRYAGEINIVKIGHESDERTNVIASILQDDLYLLNYIEGGMKFYFCVV